MDYALTEQDSKIVRYGIFESIAYMMYKTHYI